MTNQSNAGVPGIAGIDTSRNSLPHFVEVHVMEINPFTSKQGKPMWAINQTQVYLSGQQLMAKQCEVPELLQGTTLLVDFYKKGDVLPLTGVTVNDDDVLVRGFIIEQDKELLRDVAKELKIESVKARVLETLNNTAARNAARRNQISATPGTAISEAGIPAPQQGQPATHSAEFQPTV